MNLRLVCLFVCLILSFGSICYGDDSCKELSAKGEYDKAIAVCTTVIDSPGGKTASAYDNRGFAYFKKGMYDEAISDFTKAIELDSKDAFAYNTRGSAYGKKGQYDKSIADSTKAIKLDAENSFSYQVRAVAYEGKKQYDKALADWGKAIELSPEENSYLNRARLHRSVGNYNAAIKDYSSVIQKYPDRISGYWFRAAVYYENGMFAEDVRDCRKLMEIFAKDFPEIKLDLMYIRLLNAAGKLSREEYDKVLKELKGYVSSSAASSGDEKWWRTISLYYLGTPGMTEKELLEEARNGKDERAVLVRLCDANYSIGEKKFVEGDRKSAEAFFGKSVETSLPSFSYRYAKAMLKLMKEHKI